MIPIINSLGFINGITLIIGLLFLAKREKMVLKNEPFSNLLSQAMHPKVAKLTKIFLFLFLISQYLFFINLILKVGAGRIWETIVILSVSTVAGGILTFRPPKHKYDVHHFAAIICLTLMGLGGIVLSLKLDTSNISLIVAIGMTTVLLFWGRRQELNARQETAILLLLSLWNILISRLFFS